MTSKTRQEALSPILRDGSDLPTPNTGIGMDVTLVTPQKITLKLDAVEIAVAAADDFGSVKLLDWPDANLHVLGAEVNLSIVKGGTTNGIVAATDLDIGIGSAAASNATLATTMIDFLEKIDVNDDALTVAVTAASTVGQSTATFPKQIADGATNALYLNLAAAITADDTVAVSGTIDIYVVSLGNRGS
jgi:hypothetical protein